MEYKKSFKAKPVKNSTPITKILSDIVSKINNGSITVIKQDDIVIQININEKILLQDVV